MEPKDDQAFKLDADSFKLGFLCELETVVLIVICLSGCVAVSLCLFSIYNN